MSRQTSTPMSTHLDLLAQAARVLARRLSPALARKAAIAVLSAGFLDVALPEAPLPLTEKEAKTLRRQLAHDMSVALARAAETAATRDLTEEEFAALAEVVDPLWRALAVTEWASVSRLEARARQTASNVVASIVGQAHAASVDPRSAAAVVLAEVEAGTPRGQHLIHLVVAQGAGSHHLIAALRDAIDQ